ncbi:stalk domain-containing protein [Paenibacillus daejeonensis]|uniref:stalk domain-containing protein n=1 Tax=Paenibacillus daejeonensis TaxID=135193 RepID=UPI000362CD16|nr:stalk domain-containing protein [Paenibacillus daejeonensis]
MKKWTFLTTLLALAILAVVPAPAFAATPKIIDVQTSGTYTYIFKSDNSVWQFGYFKSVPTRLDLPQPAKKIVAADYDTIVLFEDGTVWRYPREEHLTPAPIPGLTDIIDLANGRIHTLALKADGTVWGWGTNFQGQLGNGQLSDSWDVPVQKAQGLTKVKAIAAGDNSLALTEQGEVYTWGGWPHSSRVTAANPEGYRITPVKVHNLPAITAIDMHGTNVLALDVSGKVHTWGQNFLQMKSTYDDGGTLTAPVQIPGIDNVQAIALVHQALFLKTDGTLYTAGVAPGQYYNLTQAQIDQQLRPHRISSLTDVTTIDASVGQLFALDTKGELYGWGNGASGYLGDGSVYWKSYQERPTRILDTGTVIINSVRQDYPGVIHQGVTMVPLRKLAEPLGATLGFEDQTKRVTISYGGQKVSMLPGDATVTVNGAPIQLGGPIRIYNNETHVPLRFISELFGAQVAWHADRAEITVTTAK